MTPWRVEYVENHPNPPKSAGLIEQHSPIEVKAVIEKESTSLILAARINPANGESLLMVQEGYPNDRLSQAFTTDLYTPQESPIENPSYLAFWGIVRIVYSST